METKREMYNEGPSEEVMGEESVILTREESLSFHQKKNPSTYLCVGAYWAGQWQVELDTLHTPKARPKKIYGRIKRADLSNLFYFYPFSSPEGKDSEPGDPGRKSPRIFFICCSSSHIFREFSLQWYNLNPAHTSLFHPHASLFHAYSPPSPLPSISPMISNPPHSPALPPPPLHPSHLPPPSISN